MIAQNLNPVKDWSDCNLSEILVDVNFRGLDPQGLLELSVIEYTDEYRSHSWLIRELAKLDTLQKNPPAPKKTKSQRLHKTPGQSAGQISSNMIFGKDVDNV